MLDAVIETIIETVASGEKVKILDFGIFEPVKKAPRLGRNPKTLVECMISARTVPVFKAGKRFKETVNT